MYIDGFKHCCIPFLVQPGGNPGIELCLSTPGICNKGRKCSISFKVQPGRSPGIEMCLSVPGRYKNVNLES